jgi:predicted anti-sigma-YlaC factor YlaD
MFSRHVSRQLAAHIDCELTQTRARQVELHLAQCANCRVEREQVIFGMEILDRLPSVEAPAAMWVSIEAALRERQSQKTSAAHRWRWALAATAASVLLGVAYWSMAHRSPTRWDVVRIDSSPKVISAGEWIETDSRSGAAVKVGEIGSVEIAPNTRLRVVTARPGEHRLALARGEIRAKISAPPRLFFVETVSGTAVDLGCEYTLNTDEAGFGLLQVTKGWVSFQWQGIESLVPAGASCRIRPNVGPGIPYFEDASETMKQALENFALNAILAEARVRDTLTLWHLLSRVDAEDRARVYDRIASLTPIPAGVSRDEALKLDAETLKRLKEELAWTW